MNISPINSTTFGKLHIAHSKSNIEALKSVVKSTESYNAMAETFKHIDRTSEGRDLYLKAEEKHVGFKENKNNYLHLSVDDVDGKSVASVDISRKIPFRQVAEKFRNLGQDYDKKMEISTHNNWLHGFDDFINQFE